MSGAIVGALIAAWLSCTAGLLAGQAWTITLSRGLDAALIGLVAGGALHLVIKHRRQLLGQDPPGREVA